MSKAIYAFSGDPITFGHLDVLERAASIFDEVIAAIGINPTKKYLFNTEERVKMVRNSIQHLPNVSVTSYQGLLADFAYENGVRVIIRGLRNAEDFNFELMLHQINDSQGAGIETFLMPCRQSLTHISSGAAKALQLEQGQIHEYVPLIVKQNLEARISGQLIIGVTGEIASGKSYLIQELAQKAAIEGIPLHSIDLDNLAHEILETSNEPVYQELRQKLMKHFGQEITTENGFINSAKLGAIIFNNPIALQQFNQMIYRPLLLRLRKATYQKRGIILLESALLAESNSLHYCNNHVIVTQCTPIAQQARLQKRCYSPKQIEQKLSAQFSHQQKLSTIENQIKTDGFGWVLNVNSGSPQETFNQMLSIYNQLKTTSNQIAA